MLDTRFFTFLVLCQTKSFTKTAEELHITQPAVSHHIKYLEEYYNVKLYTYVGKKFHLTTSGEVLYQFVSSFYTDSERIKEQLRQSNSASAMLRLGAEQSAGESFLPYLIISYLEIRFRRCSTMENWTSFLWMASYQKRNMIITNYTIPAWSVYARPCIRWQEKPSP